MGKVFLTVHIFGEFGQDTGCGLKEEGAEDKAESVSCESV